MDGGQWSVRFEYDDKDDVVYAYPCGRISTTAEAERLYATCVAYYKPFGRKLDVIVQMDMWTVSADVDIEQAARLALLEKYLRFMVVVTPDVLTEHEVKKKVEDDHYIYRMAQNAQAALAIIKELRVRQPGERSHTR